MSHWVREVVFFLSFFFLFSFLKNLFLFSIFDEDRLTLLNRQYKLSTLMVYVHKKYIFLKFKVNGSILTNWILRSENATKCYNLDDIPKKKIYNHHHHINAFSHKITIIKMSISDMKILLSPRLNPLAQYIS